MLLQLTAHNIITSKFNSQNLKKIFNISMYAQNRVIIIIILLEKPTVSQYCYVTISTWQTCCKFMHSFTTCHNVYKTRWHDSDFTSPSLGLWLSSQTTLLWWMCVKLDWTNKYKIYKNYTHHCHMIYVIVLVGVVNS